MLFISLWSLFPTCCIGAWSLRTIVLFLCQANNSCRIDKRNVCDIRASVYYHVIDWVYRPQFWFLANWSWLWFCMITFLRHCWCLFADGWCWSSDVFQRMIILWVRALDTNHNKERTSEWLTQIALSETKIKGLSRVFIFYLFIYFITDILINVSSGT